MYKSILVVIFLILATIFSFRLGNSQGFRKGSISARQELLKEGFEKKTLEQESNTFKQEGEYQFIPLSTSLEDALESGQYAYCLTYPGIGVEFSGRDPFNNLIVKETPLTYPAHQAQLLPGDKVITDLSVVIGALKSPLKLAIVKDNKRVNLVLPRVMVKKCYRKVAKPTSFPDPLKSDLSQ